MQLCQLLRDLVCPWEITLLLHYRMFTTYYNYRRRTCTFARCIRRVLWTSVVQCQKTRCRGSSCQCETRWCSSQQHEFLAYYIPLRTHHTRKYPYQSWRQLPVFRCWYVVHFGPAYWYYNCYYFACFLTKWMMISDSFTLYSCTLYYNIIIAV